MLQAINLNKTYQGHVALKDVSFDVKKGEVFCLLGQNGAGKTTTINIFLGFTEATSGKALINDLDVSADKAAVKKLIAYIPEVVQLYGNLSGIENLDFFSRLAGFTYTSEQLKQLLAQAGLEDNAHDKRLSLYSKGMRQKVGIAIALSKRAQTIFMDEPTSGLDPKATVEFTQLCRQLAQQGTVIFMATHDIFNAVHVASRIGIMREGALIHTVNASSLSAIELQDLYLETI